jgi:ribonuclease HI
MKDADSREDSSVILRAILRADGGSRGNPGESGIGYTLEAVDGSGRHQAVSSGGWYIGRATNNQAEYHALIWGLENALAKNVRMIEVEMDSELVVKQLNGEYKVRNVGIKPLFTLASCYLGSFYSASITHIKRDLNSESDRLANAAMDSRGPVGDYDVEYIDPEYMTDALAGLTEAIEAGALATAVAPEAAAAAGDETSPTDTDPI